MTYGSESPIDLHGEFKCTLAANIYYQQKQKWMSTRE